MDVAVRLFTRPLHLGLDRALSFFRQKRSRKKKLADGRAIPGDLGLSWIALGKFGDLLGGIFEGIMGSSAVTGAADILSKLSPEEKAIVEGSC